MIDKLKGKNSPSNFLPGFRFFYKYSLPFALGRGCKTDFADCSFLSNKNILLLILGTKKIAVQVPHATIHMHAYPNF